MKKNLRPLELVKLMRPKHYIKNFLILVSITFDRNLFNPAVLGQVMLGFAAFCLLTSAVYVVNDIRDVESDRQHEVKRNRPIASGAVPIPAAWVLAVGLLAAALAIQLAAFGSVTSAWVYLTVFALSFYLGLGKRRNELKKTRDSGGSTRKVLQYYSYEFLDKFMYLCLTLAVTFYALWSADGEITAKYGTDKLIWTVPLVIIILMKYSADIESDSFGDPVDVVMHDKVLLGLSALLGLAVVALIYLPGL